MKGLTLAMLDREVILIQTLHDKRATCPMCDSNLLLVGPEDICCLVCEFEYHRPEDTCVIAGLIYLPGEALDRAFEAYRKVNHPTPDTHLPYAKMED